MTNRTEMLTQLRFAKDGNAMLRVLSQVDNTEKETVVAAVLPRPGFIFNHKGEEVVFWPMKSSTVVYVFLAFVAILGYNAFLIKRDQKLFDAYDKLTPHERYCQQQARWHPDCNVEWKRLTKKTSAKKNWSTTM